jgi:hypothetical protein
LGNWGRFNPIVNPTVRAPLVRPDQGGEKEKREELCGRQRRRWQQLSGKQRLRGVRLLLLRGRAKAAAWARGGRGRQLLQRGLLLLILLLLLLLQLLRGLLLLLLRGLLLLLLLGWQLLLLRGRQQKLRGVRWKGRWHCWQQWHTAQVCSPVRRKSAVGE